MTTLRDVLGSQRQALKIAGLSRSTWHYRHHPRARAADPVPQAKRAYPSRIGEADRELIEARILAAWDRGHSIDHAFAEAWDDGVMLASRRTWWRIGINLDQARRPLIPTRRQARTPREAPVVEATAPGQAWSWDITDLFSPWRGCVYKAYKITDIYTRQIVGYRVEDREVDELAVEMFQAAIAAHGTPTTVHADSGAAMRSNALRHALEQHDVTLSHNRPYVSNDNPFSEAGFRTMKYRPGYPRIFQTLDDARAYLDQYVHWYNTQHHHSGIALFTPQQVADGTWHDIWNVRDAAQQAYYQRHPERFRNQPTTPAPATRVGINLPTETTQAA